MIRNPAPDDDTAGEDVARRTDEHGADGGGATPADTAADTPGSPLAALDEQRCDLCGAPLLEWHCRLICTSCGFQRDCSDP